MKPIHKTLLGTALATIVTLILTILHMSGVIQFSGMLPFFGLFLAASIAFLTAIAMYIYRLNKGHIRKVFHYLTVYLAIITGGLIAIESIEWITGWIFLYKFTWWPYYMILLIYPLSLWLLILTNLTITMHSVKIGVSVLFVFGTFITGYFHIFVAMLGTKSTTDVVFEERDLHLVLVEDSFLFSSSHQLYEKVNGLFVDEVYSDGSWSCNDGCVIRSPESYQWTWIDDETLVVSGEGMFEPVTFYFSD